MHQEETNTAPRRSARRSCRARIASSISAKVILLFLGVLLVALANILVARALLRELNGVAETVNVAGRLRMLSQQIAYHGARVVRHNDPAAEAALARSIGDYESAVAALASGGEAFGFTLRRVPIDAMPYLDALRGDWQRFRWLRAAIIHPDPAAGAEHDPAALMSAIGQAQAVQLQRAEALVMALTRDAQGSQQDALSRMYSLLVIDVLLLALAFAGVRRRLVAPLRNLAMQSRALARGDYNVRVYAHGGDEIGQLAQAFNYSAERIGRLVADIEADRQSIRQAEITFRGLAENSVVGVYIVCDGRFHFVNPTMAEMFGYERDEMLAGAHLSDIVVEQERDFVEQNRQRRINGEVREVHYERRARRKDGSIFDVEVYGSSMLLGRRPATIGVILDITERRRTERALMLQNACSEALIRATDESALLQEVCRILQETGGHAYAWVETVDEPNGASLPNLATPVLSLCLQAASTVFGTLHVCARISSDADTDFSGDERRILQRIADNLSYGIAALRVEVARKRYEAQLEYGANFDALTGLANRTLLSSRLRLACLDAARRGNMVGVLLHDLDNFKVINDSLGHEAGDVLLQAVAQRMRAAVRQGDTVARLGGDEFVVVAPSIDGIEDVQRIAAKLLAELARPFTIERQQIYVSASIGVCLYPRDGEYEQTLLKNVDLAMYRAKHEGRNTVRFFTEELHAHNRERQKMEAALHEALEQEQFELYYQPKIDYATGAVTGMEALVRWNHPELGVVEPGAFIGLAEENGLIERLGTWVLRTACLHNRALQDSGGPKLVVAVNLSARQLRPEKLLATVSDALARSGLAPQYLELELTETAIMKDAANSIAILSQLKDLGVRLSLDDFGTGYSSLDYLRRFPFDSIKIDRSFIIGLKRHENDRAIVKTIIALASNLNMTVIAEGVEEVEQAEFLMAHACREMQGFLFARALASDQLRALLADYAERAGKGRVSSNAAPSPGALTTSSVPSWDSAS